MKKKILHIAEPFATGVFMFVVNLANKQCEDYEVYIAHGMRPLTHPNYLDFFDKRIKLFRVENFAMEINPSKDFKAFLEIRKLLERIQPDIVHMHSSKSGVIGRIALSFKNVRQFYSPHGFSFLMESDSKMKRFVYRSIEKLFSKFNCTIVASSQGEFEEALRLSNKSKLVNNGIEMKELEMYEYKIVPTEKRKTLVVTVGRILYQKNPALFNEIAIRMPDVDFLWIGEGDLRNCLNAPNIRIVGWGKREDALEMLAQSDIYLMTSLWEGMPLSLLEAMCLKKVCIVSNVIGNRDVIKDQINGFICRNVDEFVSTIQAVINGSFAKGEIVGNAYADIKAEYNTDVMYLKFNQLYNQ